MKRPGFHDWRFAVGYAHAVARSTGRRQRIAYDRVALIWRVHPTTRRKAQHA